MRYGLTPLVLLGWLWVRKVYVGCAWWTYWPWGRVYWMLLLLLLGRRALYSCPRCVCLWGLCGGKFHSQGHSSLLELPPVASGHSRSKIAEPHEKTFPLTIMHAYWWPYKVTRKLLHHCHELAIMGCLLIRGCLLIHVSGSLLGSVNGRWRCQGWCKLFRCVFSCVARATLVAPVVIRGFVRVTICGWWETTEHRISSGPLECLLTLLVERCKEGVAFMFPFLQSC